MAPTAIAGLVRKCIQSALPLGGRRVNAPRSAFLQFRRKLVLGYLALCALLVGLLVWKMGGEYRADRKAALGLTQNSARAMAAHVRELIEVVDQPLRGSAAAISKLSSDMVTPEAVEPLLAASSRDEDSRFWLVFIDASGRGVVANNGLAVQGVSFSDRPYFAKLATSPGADLFIGGPTVGRVSKRRLFFLSRRVESNSGEFLGVVAASLDAERIADVFERARLGEQMSIALATLDNVVISRAPLFAESFGVRISSPPVAIPSSLSSGSFEADSPFRGERRLFSYMQVGKLPLRVVVGATRESWMAHFRSDLLAGVVGTAIALLVALFSGRFALEQFRRLERVEAWQRKLIDTLALAKHQLVRGEQRVRMIADSVPARVAYVNIDERYTFHNVGEHGAPIGAMMGKTLLETHGAQAYAAMKDGVAKALMGERVVVELSYQEGGELRHFKHQYTPDLIEDGRVMGFYAMVTDITESKMIQQRLAEVARVDALTGLPNRAELLDRLGDALARCRRVGDAMACLYLDIDRFKEVNDTLGHAGGDAALVEFGRRLRQCVRECDLVARLAGDEFVIVLEGISKAEEAHQVAAKIIASMEKPFSIEGERWPVTTSVGVVVADATAADAKALLGAADQALYQAKRGGRNQVASVSLLT
jgi:diguanylate cyclase (GGDEF)-like protein